MNLLESALRHASEGYAVLPCKPGTKLPLTRHGFHDASADPEQIRSWWEHNPQANVAVVPGEGRSVVLDIDGETGRKSLLTLDLPAPGRITVSPGKGGGFHYWYRLPARSGTVENRSPWPGIDIRGHNGYVMVPPSVHPDTGTEYVYARDDPLTELPAVYLPGSTAEPRSLLGIRRILRRVPQNPTREARAKLEFYLADIGEQAEGARHDAMLQAVWDLAALVFAGELTHDEVASRYGAAYLEACAPWPVEGDFMSALTGAYRKLPEPAGTKLTYLLASESAPRRARWLWHQRIPLGALSLLAGRQGIGKSTIMFDMISRLSTGTLPGDLEGIPRGAAIVATEDSWEEKILPSLIYTGADLSKVAYVTSQGPDWVTDVVLPDDLDELRRICESVGAGVLVFDPITSRLASRLDTHKDSDVRRALEPLAGFARVTGTSVLGLIHVNKGGSDPLSSVMGSSAFTAAARSVLFTARLQDGLGMSVIKSNSGPSNESTERYALEVGEVRDMPAVRVRWGELIPENVEELTAPRNRDARDWLATLLSSGPVPTSEVQDAARSAGIGLRRLKEACDALGVVKRASGFQGTWVWEIDRGTDPC